MLASLLAQLRRQPRYASAICPSTATRWQTSFCGRGVSMCRHGSERQTLADKAYLVQQLSCRTQLALP